MCYRCGVISDEIFTLCIFVWRVYWMVVDLFRSCDLDLDPMTFIYEFDPYSTKIYRM